MSEHSWQNENELGAKHFSDYMNSFGYTVNIYLLFILVRLDIYYIFCLYCLAYIYDDRLNIGCGALFYLVSIKFSS